MVHRLARPFLAATVLVALVSGNVLAGGKPTTVPLGFPPEGIELPAGAFCDFGLFVTAVKNTEMITTFPLEDDGSQRAHIFGQLWIRVSNVNTDASVILKISGPSLVLFHPDGSTSATFLGRSLPVQPGQFLVTSGRIVQITNTDGSTVLGPTPAHTIDVCAVLAP